MSEFTFLEKPRVSCALGGALATVNALPRTVALLHASLGCGGMTSNANQNGSGYLGSGYCGGNSIPTTSIGEREIVFGGLDRLEEQLRNTAEIIDADLFVVITGCTAEIIGDDVESTIREYNENRGDNPPAILASGAGFKGDSQWGYDSAMEAIFRSYVNPPFERKQGLVNVLGILPAQDVWWRGDLLEIRRILTGLGLEVNTFFTAQDSLDKIRQAAEAELNIVLSPTHGITTAEVAEELYSTPWLATGLPVGAKATTEFVLEIAKRLELDQAKVDAFLAEERRSYYQLFNRLADAYADIDLQRYAVVVGNVRYAHAFSKFVSTELGWITPLVVITDQVESSLRPALVENFRDFLEDADDAVVFETDTSLIETHLAERWPRPDGGRYYQPFSPAFVLGSRLDKEFAEGLGISHLSVSYPVSNRVILNRGYAGFTGGLSLTEDIYTVALAAR